MSGYMQFDPKVSSRKGGRSRRNHSSRAGCRRSELNDSKISSLHEGSSRRNSSSKAVTLGSGDPRPSVPTSLGVNLLNLRPGRRWSWWVATRLVYCQLGYHRVSFSTASTGHLTDFSRSKINKDDIFIGFLKIL